MLDEYDMPSGPGRAEVRLRAIPVLKVTPKGVWLACSTLYSEKRFVRREARKRFACPTKEEAMESFIARKNRQRQIYSARVRHINEVLNLVEKERGKLLHAD